MKRIFSIVSSRCCVSRSRQAAAQMKTGFARLGIGWMLAMGAPAHAETTNPEPAEVYSIIMPMGGVAVQPDGKIVVSDGCVLHAVNTASGEFSMTTSGAFRFNPDGSLDHTFRFNRAPNNLFNTPHEHIIAASDGRLLLTGVFNAVDGKPRSGIAMLLSDGKLDKSFEPWRGWTNAPGRCGRGAVLYDAALLTNGCVAVPSFVFAGRFPNLTAYVLDSSGAFLPRPGIDVISNDWNFGRMSYFLRDGGFGVQRSVDWGRTNHTTWTSWPKAYPSFGFPWWGDPPSAADVAVELTALFKEAPIELCRYAVSLPGGGAILAVQGTNDRHLMRFNSAWLPDFSFTNSFEALKRKGISIIGDTTNSVETDDASYLTLALQPDGKLLLAGVSKLNGEPVSGIGRLLPDGSTDPRFHCVLGGDLSLISVMGTAGISVMGMALQADGRILIVGLFTEVNGVKCPYFARLNPDGSLDTDFQSHFTTSDNLKARMLVQMLASRTNLTVNPAATTTNAATTMITSEPQTVLITSLNLDGGVAVIRFQGNPSQTYILQCREALDASAWSSIETNQTDSAGTGLFRDGGAKNFSTRFYCIASPQ